MKVKTRLSVYTVRIDYENGGMERMDVCAMNRMAIFPHLIRLLKLKWRNTGCQKTIKSITIERE